MVGNERYYMRLVVHDEDELAARRSGLHGPKPEKL
jgi:hypothetical protein